MSTSKEGQSEFTIWNVPDDVKKEFKIACLKKDVTMKDTIIKFMKRFALNAKS